MGAFFVNRSLVLVKPDRAIPGAPGNVKIGRSPSRRFKPVESVRPLCLFLLAIRAFSLYSLNTPWGVFSEADCVS